MNVNETEFFFFSSLVFHFIDSVSLDLIANHYTIPVIFQSAVEFGNPSNHVFSHCSLLDCCFCQCGVSTGLVNCLGDLG